MNFLSALKNFRISPRPTPNRPIHTKNLSLEKLRLFKAAAPKIEALKTPRLKNFHDKIPHRRQKPPVSKSYSKEISISALEEILV